MTVEEIENRWGLAELSPWSLQETDCDETLLLARAYANSETTKISIGRLEDLYPGTQQAIAAAPTDIAYLLYRVRKLERAHAWFVENTNTNDSRRVVDHCQYCGRCDWARFPHDCEWLKAKELRL